MPNSLLDNFCVDVYTPNPGVAAAVRFFESIVNDEHWRPGNALQSYLPHSVYFSLTSGRQVVGALQLVLPTDDAAWWPSRAIWPECDPSNDHRVGHVLITAVHKEFRARGDLFWLLCISLWRYCEQVGIDEIRLESTPATSRAYQRLGLPIEVIGVAREHWGEVCLPTRILLKQVSEAGKRKVLASPSFRNALHASDTLSLLDHDQHRLHDRGSTQPPKPA